MALKVVKGLEIENKFLIGIEKGSNHRQSPYCLSCQKPTLS